MDTTARTEHQERIEHLGGLIARLRLDAEAFELMEYEDGDEVYELLNRAELLLSQRAEVWLAARC